MVRTLAIDLGASSGRALIGELDGDRIKLSEIHRFSNDPVILGGTMYWDVLRLVHEIKQSLVKAKHAGGIDSIGIDTWGVDFGLIDKDGRLIENPVHYRDARTNGILSHTDKKISRKRLYELTGIQIMEINTAFQLAALEKSRPGLLERADRLLLMPDLLAYFLSGSAAAEMSIASTTQLLDAHTKQWSDECAKALGIPAHLLQGVVSSGTVTGVISGEICKELDIPPSKVISVCGHDTQSAVVAVPADTYDFAFLSCGTWSLLGTELDEPIINEASAALNISNETGYGGKTSFLKNIIGLWLIQESRRQWQREGKDYSFAELEVMAAAAKPFACFIDPDAPEFTPAGNIPARVKEYCKKTGQHVPESDGEVMRCIYESLALKYRRALRELEQCTKKRYDTLYTVGGGTKDKLLSKLTADACGIKVRSGPVEATALGNIAVQLITLGALRDLRHAREVISRSESTDVFLPRDTDKWDEADKSFDPTV